MTNRVTISSTHVDLHGDRMSKEALEMGVRQINSERSIPITVEHNRTLPPLGRLSQAEVLQGDDGEYCLIAHREYFDGTEQVQLNNGEMLVKEYFTTGGRPFSIRKEPLELIEISVDLHNFDSSNEVDQFYNELEQSTNIRFKRAEHLRKSFHVDLELIIRLAESALYLFFSKQLVQKLLSKTGDKFAEKIADDAARLYDLIKNAVIKLGQKAIPQMGPKTYVIELPANISIVLIAIDKSPEQIVEAIQRNNMQSLESKINELIDRFQAEKIQFILNDNLKWEINYLLTINGESLGTEKSLKQRAVVLQNMIQP